MCGSGVCIDLYFLGIKKGDIISLQSQGNIYTKKVCIESQMLFLQIQDSINIESINETTLRTKGNLLFTSNAAMGFETDTNATSDNILSEVASDYTINTGNSLNFNIGETTITATSDSVIIKAGGVEVAIDSKGLKVSRKRFQREPSKFYKDNANITKRYFII